MPYLEIHQKDDGKIPLLDFVEDNFTLETRKVTFECEFMSHSYRRLFERYFDFYAQSLYEDGIACICPQKMKFAWAREVLLKDIASPLVQNITIKITNDENMD